MTLLETIERNQMNAPKMFIGIDAMPIRNELKERVLIALQNNEDFALENDSGGRAYFINAQFMIIKTKDNKDNSVTHLPDSLALQNSLKLALLGHGKFVSCQKLLADNNYKLLKDAAK